MKQTWLIVLGAILAVLGGIWTLQGLNVLGGSAMSGSSFWAIVGPIVLVVGIVLIGVGIARRRTK